MRILFLAISPQAHAGAGGRTRIVAEARVAVAAGHEVRLLCLVPLRHYVRWFRLRAARRQLALDAGCPVAYARRVPVRPLAWLQRALDRRRVRREMRRTFDVVHCHGTAVASIALAARSAGPHPRIVADVHGAAAEEYRYASGDGMDAARYERLRRQEIEVVRTAAACVFVSQRMATFFETEYDAQPRASVVVPCATRPSQDTAARRLATRKARGFTDRLVLGYLGSWRRYQLPDETITLLGALLGAFPQAHIWILSSHVDRFRDALRQAGIPAERCTVEAVTHDEVFSLLPAFDIGLLLRDAAPVNRVASPTKFAEYLASGVPVLTTPHVGDYSALVAKHAVGHAMATLALDAAVTTFVQDVLADRAAHAERCLALAGAGLTWDQQGPRLRSVWTSSTTAGAAPRDTP